MVSADWSRILVAVLVVGLVAAMPASVATVTAKAPPEPVCGVCTDALDEAASNHGATVERDTATMTVQLDENATARFTARVALEAGATALQNDTRRTAIVRDVSYTLVDERRNLQTELDGHTLVVRYDATEVAHTSVAILQFDAFQTRAGPLLGIGGEGAPYPGADRLVLRAPSGFEVHGSHGDASNATAVVWEGNSHEQYAGHIEEGVVISFVPENVSVPGIRVVLANLFGYAGPPLD